MFSKKWFGVFFYVLSFPFVCYAEMRIVTVVPKSGSYAAFGDELSEGARVAVDEINDKGGLNGEKIRLIETDDACSKDLAISTAQMLSSKTGIRPQLVIGPYCSEGLEQIAKIYEKAHIFQIVPAFLTLTDVKKSSSGIIKLFGNKEQASSDVFDFYNAHFAGDYVAVVSLSSDESFDLSVLEAFKKHGKASLIKQYRLKDFEDIDVLVSSLKDDGVKVVMLFDNAKYAGKIIKKLSSVLPQTIFLTNRYIVTTDFLKHAQDYLENTYFMALPELENEPEMTQNVVALRLKGIEFKGLNIYGYTAVKIWAELVLKYKTSNYVRLSSQIKKHGLKTSWGETFFANGNIKKPLKYSFYKLQGDEYVIE